MKKYIGFFLIFLIIFLFDRNSFAADKTIILTFDDGPRPNVLLGKNGRIGLFELLKARFEKFIPAHFFMVGERVNTFPESVLIAYGDRFRIENHTYNHENLIQLMEKGGRFAVIETIKKTDTAIFKITGKRPRYFRSPYLAIDNDIKYIITRTDFGDGRYYHDTSSLECNVNTFDYRYQVKNRSFMELAGQVEKIITDREKQGKFQHILIFHELPITVNALKVLIPHFLSQSYTFRTLDD